MSARLALSRRRGSQRLTARSRAGWGLSCSAWSPARCQSPGAPGARSAGFRRPARTMTFQDNYFGGISRGGISRRYFGDVSEISIPAGAASGPTACAGGTPGALTAAGCRGRGGWPPRVCSSPSGSGAPSVSYIPSAWRPGPPELARRMKRGCPN
eukprot:SAG31_NODE_1149_length_9659_cov_4.862238_7_plen_155_part_00